MTKFKKTALITGASSGIDLEFAKILSQEKYDLVLVSRSRGDLQKISKQINPKQKISIKIIVQDLKDPNAVQAIFNTLRKEKIQIEVLINSAGFGLFGNFSELSFDKQLEMIQVNIMALTTLTRLVLEDMVKKRKGKILNIASIAAFQPGPLMAVYYATKAYVLSFSEALASELKGTGVTVTALCPGPTDTEFQRTADLQKFRLYDEMSMSAEEVAQIGFKGLMQGKTVIIPGIKNKIIFFATRIIPRNLTTSIVGRLLAMQSS